MNALDPFQLAARQIELDRARPAALPALPARKLSRMQASPLAFLRGSAPLFYEILRQSDELAAGPPGEGWILGDAHLENFGAFAPTRVDTAKKQKATFDLNDFDECAIGPWRWDVLRLTTSLILAARELGLDGPRVLQLSEALIDGYVAAAFTAAPLPVAPRPVAELIAQVQGRSRQQLLDARTVVLTLPNAKNVRRFERGSRYWELEPAQRDAVPSAFGRYIASLSDAERPAAEQVELVDCAFRVAGTGSLGALRVAVLTTGKGGVAGGFVFDMKEQLPKSMASALAVPPREGASATVAACLACLALPPRQLGTAQLELPGGAIKSMVVRRLTPQEDKLEFGRLQSADLGALACYLGALVGRAHARGATSAVGSAWTTTDQAEMLERAVACAGLHEATYLAFCLLTRGR